MRMPTGLPAILAIVSIGSGVAVTQSHPHFDDGGALHWYRSLAEAQAAARQQDKLIFIEYGRKA